MILEIIETGQGVFSPIVFILASILASVLAYALIAPAKKSFKKSEAKEKPFLSGNALQEKNRIKAGDYFYGFFKAMNPYYSQIIKIHTGIVNDYAFWFIATAFCFLLLLLAGVLL